MAHTSPPPEPLLTPRNVLLALGVMLLLAGCYWLTYSGLPISNDELLLFDGVQGMVRRGNTQITTMLDQRTIRDYDIGQQPHMPLVDAEPMQMALATPLFALAERLPGVGMMHAVWLFNILVCAATGAVFFLFARALAYSASVSLAAALILGLGTLVWPYSKLFFREPLAMFLLFSAALCLERWRRLRWRRAGWGWLIGFAILFLMALLTKEAALFSIPVFVLLIWPESAGRLNRRQVLRLLLIGAAVALLIVVSILLLNRIFLARYNVIIRLAEMQGKLPFMLYALLSYLFSPGRSLIAFAPVLLLGLPGIWMLLRHQRVRQGLVPLVAAGVYIAGYAVLRHENWFAGLSWGPRYLMPVTPFAMLAVLPALEAAAGPRASRLARAGAMGIVALSIWAQLNGVLIRQPAYFAELSRRGVIAWEGGVWVPEHTPLVVTPSLLASNTLDFAWVRASSAGLWLPLGAGVLLASGGILAWAGLRRALAWRAVLLAGGAALIVTPVVFYSGLRSIYADPGYMGDFAALHDLVEEMNTAVPPEDIVVLSSPEYRLYVMNSYRGRSLVYTLPLSPGEQPSPAQPPRVTSTNPDALIEPRHTIFLDNLPEYTGRVWILENSGPFTGYTVRPVEWYMARHYFPTRVIETDQTARLIAFDVNACAPMEQAMRWPEHLIEATFGENIDLVGVDLPPARIREGPYAGPGPSRTAYRPGETIPLSLLWRARQTPALDYNVGVFLIGPEGTAVEQHGPPQWAFRPMNTWRPGETVRDNRGLELPPDLPDGIYEIWVNVYDWRTGEPLPVSGADRTVDGRAARLGTVTIER